MARGPRKPQWGKGRRDQGSRQNKSGEGCSKKRLLDMRREKYFKFDLQDVIEKTSNSENKGIISATLLQKASQMGIDEAIEYVNRISGESLEKDIAEEVKRLLMRYSTYR